MSGAPFQKVKARGSELRLDVREVGRQLFVAPDYSA